MKNILPLIVCLFSIHSIHAQISISRSDIGSAGDKVYYGVDTSLGNSFSQGIPGANITWDFTTAAHANYYDSTVFADPAGIPNAPSQANLAIIEGGGGEPRFLSINNNELKLIIPLEEITGENKLVKIAGFPFTYGAQEKDSAFTQKSGTPEDFGFSGLPFDSIRVTINIRAVSTTDGWGSLKTAGGTYNALRVKNETAVDAIVEGQAFGMWTPIPLDGLSQTVKMYAWYGKDKTYSLAEAALDTNDKVVYFKYQVDELPVTALSEASINMVAAAYPNPANELLTITYNGNSNASAIVKILDITGKTVSTENVQLTSGKNNLSIHTSALPDGIYLAHILSGTQTGVSRFMVKH